MAIQFTAISNPNKSYPEVEKLGRVYVEKIANKQLYRYKLVPLYSFDWGIENLKRLGFKDAFTTDHPGASTRVVSKSDEHQPWKRFSSVSGYSLNYPTNWQTAKTTEFVSLLLSSPDGEFIFLISEKDFVSKSTYEELESLASTKKKFNSNLDKKMLSNLSSKDQAEKYLSYSLNKAEVLNYSAENIGGASAIVYYGKGRIKNNDSIWAYISCHVFRVKYTEVMLNFITISSSGDPDKNAIKKLKGIEREILASVRL